MTFVDVIRINEIPIGSMQGKTVNGKDILIANYEGRYYAIGGTCTHAGGNLVRGKLNGKIVTCPVHGSKFDVTTGNRISGPS